MMSFNYLRSLLEGFVILAPKALIDDASFDSLHRCLIACGADVIGEGLRESTKSPTHVIVWPDQSSPPVSACQVLTVEWLQKSIRENVLQPLPIN